MPYFKRILRAASGWLLFGIAPDDEMEMTILGRGLPGSELRRLSIWSLVDGQAGEEVAR